MVSIRRNEERDGIELVFTGKPPDEIRSFLKSKRFKWSPYAKVWCKKYNETDWSMIHEYFEKPLPVESITEELQIGIAIEKEHTDNPVVAEKIANDHLKENPQYYSEPKPREWAKKEINKKSQPELRKKYLDKVYKETDNPITIYLVDGEAIRKDHVEFTMGGHGYVYDYIPENEIWIDENLEGKPDDLEATIKHEMFEVRKMRDEGLSYDKAHELANKMEEKIRQEPEASPQKKLNPFIAFYKDKRYELYADSKYAAQLQAAEFFKVPAKDSYKVSVHLAEEEEKDKPLRAEAEKSEPKDDIAEVRLQKSMSLRKFISVSQYEVLADLMMGEEGGAGWEIVDTLGGIIKTMPHTYQTEKTDTDDKIVYLHYFKGGSDWYIVEKDKLPVQNQAFGYAILGGNTINAEWEYISILELIQSDVELDFYFTPVKFGDLKKKWQDEPEETDISDNERIGEQFTRFLDSLSELDLWKEFTFPHERPREYRKFILSPSNERAVTDYGIKERMQDIIVDGKPMIAAIISVLKGSETKDDIEVAYRENTGIETVLKTSQPEAPIKKTYIGGRPVTPEESSLHTGQVDKNLIPVIPVIAEIIKNDKLASLSLSDYKTDFDKNKAIEKLLLAHPESTYQWSDEEKIFLKGYTGYGGLDDEAIKAGVKLDTGSLDEFYTPDPVIEKMWLLVEKYKLYDIQSICEPSVGIGSFFDRRYVGSHIRKTAYELNPFSARIVKILYPETQINVGADEGYFEQLFVKNNYTVRNKVVPEHDLVIGNPPYRAAEGPYMGRGEKEYSHAKNYIDYFIFRGLDVLKKDGLLVYIIGAEVAAGGHPWLDQGNSKCKDMIAAKGKLIDAYRLPEGLFDRTNVVCDIVVFRKR